MNIKCLFVVGASLLAGSLSADALYWMIDESKNKDVDFTYAKVKATNKDGESHYLQIPDPYDPDVSYDAIFADGVTADNPTGRSVGNGDGVWADIGSYGDGWSYSIVLWGADETNPVGMSDPTSFGDLIATSISHMSEDGVTPIYASSPWSPDVYAADVPEPTSGLLTLFGLAGLALRRKRCSLKL